MKILAPAGDLEKLVFAYLYGADACYIGGELFSLRSHANNFSNDDLIKAVKIKKRFKKELYVAFNVVFTESIIDLAKEQLAFLATIDIDGIIVSSLSMLKYVKKNHSNLKVSISTQTSISSTAQALLYQENKADRIILARELTIEEIKDIESSVHTEVEVFIHGGVCTSYSGLCELSKTLCNRDANLGNCAHSCRWNYFSNFNKSINVSIGSKDLMGIKAVGDLYYAGVDILKIEGRMKSLHYISTITNIYRTVLTKIMNNDFVDFDYWIKEINKAENRETFEGYFYGLPNEESLLYNSRSEKPKQIFVGIVKSFCEKSNELTIQQRNFFPSNASLEFFSYDGSKQIIKIQNLYNLEGQVIDAARHPLSLVKIIVSKKIRPYTLVRLNNE